MKVAHVEVVKEKLGTEALKVLSAVFNAASGEPPGVEIQRFRADHHKWIDVLDRLQNSHALLERSHDGSHYHVRSYALPLIDDAKPILVVMQQLFGRLRELYLRHLSECQPVDTLIAGLSGERKQLLDALYYLTESHNIWSGKANGFPYSDGSCLSISENVLRHESIGEILSQYYEWHYVNPRNVVTSWMESEGEQELSTFFGSGSRKDSLPDWYEQLDDIKKALIREIDVSIQCNLSALPTIGLRTLLEVVMVEKVGDIGGFEKKLEKFKAEGYITGKESELIASVLDAGNAAAHRAYFPDAEDIRTCVDVVKHLMEGVFILQPKIQKVRDNTPPRPGRRG